jgi:hypothetical protein
MNNTIEDHPIDAGCYVDETGKLVAHDDVGTQRFSQIVRQLARTHLVQSGFARLAKSENKPS